MRLLALSREARSGPLWWAHEAAHHLPETSDLCYTDTKDILAVCPGASFRQRSACDEFGAANPWRCRALADCGPTDPGDSWNRHCRCCVGGAAGGAAGALVGGPTPQDRRAGRASRSAGTL